MMSWMAAAALADEQRLEAALQDLDRPRVELVIALDVSGSMSNLLDSARMRLWEVVDLVGQASPQPELRVGLIAYGTGAELVAHLPLTSELDAVSDALMQLGISGGDEFVGHTIRTATRASGWSAGHDAIKLLFVCGNETTAQGPVEPGLAAALALEDGITVNALFGGTEHHGRTLGWSTVAEQGGGLYLAIDMRAGTVRLPEAPQDALLETLNAELNETYVRIPGALDGKSRMLEQDALSRGLGTSGTRLSTKGSALYRNETWDLVDAWEAGRLDLSETQRLPAHLHDEALDGREAYVAGLRDHRRKIQARIRDVADERRTWMVAETARLQAAQPSLDDAIRAAVRSQLQERGLSL